MAANSGVPVRAVSKAELARAARTDAPQGVIAHAAPLAEVGLGQLCSKPAGGPAPFLVVLDGVTDPHNLGAVLRSAACAGCTGAVVPRHRGSLVVPAVTKAAAGAVEHLPIAVVGGVAGALAELASHGVWTVGLEAGTSASLFDVRLAGEPVALVLGSEGSGLSRLVRHRCDVVASIPQSGLVESLNVAAAAAVACFDLARRRRL